MKKTYEAMNVKDLGAFKTLTTGSGPGNADAKAGNFGNGNGSGPK